MRRTDRLRWSQLKIGILLVVGFLILLWASFNSGLPAFLRRDEPMVARFPSAEGLLTGAPVFFLGMEAGSVQGVAFEPEADTHPIVVRFQVVDRVRRELRANAGVEISSLGLLGDKILVLQRGDAPEPLPEDAVLRGSAETAFTDLIEPGQDALARLDSLLGTVQSIATDVRRGEGTVGSLLTEDALHRELVSTLSETRRTMSDFRRTQEAVGTQLAATAQSFDSLAVAFRTGEGTLARMREDPSLYENLDAAAARLERVLAEVQTGDGLMSRALRDPVLADEFTGVVTDLRALLRDMRENPGRYVQFSVF